MLYVFHVDVGRMLSFDMTVALSSVENLKETIERLYGIPSPNIVLLVSGGEVLAASTQVSCYSAGTDTNPIYMFLKGDIKMPPLMAPMEADLDLREQVELSKELPANYDTVVKRAQIAYRMYEMARDDDRLCERLVLEQHLQQQGWSTVVANMEDLTEELEIRFHNFCMAFDKHLQCRSSYFELLQNFNDDLTKLSRIPILPGLMPLAEADFHAFDEFLENDDVFSRSTNQQQSVLMVGANTPATGKKASNGEAVETTGAGAAGFNNPENVEGKSSCSTSPNKKLKMANDSNEERSSQTSQTSITSNTARRLNLLQWITSKENHNVLKTMSDECVQGLATFNEEVYEKLKLEVQSIIKLAHQAEVKEIRGLGERLFKLDEIKYKIKSMVKDQKELSTAFQQNQNRAINLRDSSILPDLCASHQSQLFVMLQNHRKIRDNRHIIAKAKDELGANLHARLSRIVYIENAMSEFDNRLLFYHRCLRRAERHIHIIEQIHQAPNMYVAAVTEVMRRKTFSSEFRVWASKLAVDFESIQSEEMKRRQQFNINFEGHFLNILFPGMADMPPAFANESPLSFDVRLPNITRSDIDVLTTHLPEMASQMQLPDMEPVIYFFVSHSGTHQGERFEQMLKQRQKRAAEELKQVTGEDEQPAMVVSGKTPLNPRLSELRKDTSGSGSVATGGGGGAGEESETDTETEFEQVPPNGQQSIATSTRENQQQTPAISRSTITDQLITQSAETLTDENSETLKNEVTHMRVMSGAMSKLALECIHLARSNLQTFREESIIQKEDMQSDLQILNDQWNLFRMNYEAREQEFVLKNNQREHEITQLNDEIKKRELELKEEKKLTCHMSEMKIKCVNLEAQLDELKEKLSQHDKEKEEAILQAREELLHKHKTEIESLRQRYKLMTSMERSPSDLSLEHNSLSDNVIEKNLHENILSQLRSELEVEKEKAITTAIEMERSIWQSKIFPLNSESVMVNVSILREMLEEKERQLEQLREKDLMLTKENYQLKTRIDALTNEEGNSWLKEKIDYLNRDKNRLEEELNNEKSKRLEMETSFAAIKGSTYEQPSGSRSKSSGSGHKVIVLESCAKGDLVLIVWSMRHCQFMVVQDSPNLYFVHGESLSALNLHLPHDDEEVPMPYYALARVVDKEYCLARRDENRYHVERGTKFYRIKLAPLVSARQSLRRERLESCLASISRSTSQCESHSEVSQTFASAMQFTTAAASSSQSAMTTTAACSIANLNKDVVERAVGNTVPLATSPITVITTSGNNQATSSTPAAMLSYKERTVSITSVTEEDEEPVSLLNEGCRYISVNEEVEHLMAASPPFVAEVIGVGDVATAATQNIHLHTQQTQTTVITEQPTATASKLELDLMLASADINPSTSTVQAPVIVTSSTQNDGKLFVTTNSSNTIVSIDETPQIVVSSSSSSLPSKISTQTTSTSAAIIIPPNPELADKISPSIPTSVGTTSEDSDEYRSLEPKDEADFPIYE